MKLLENVTRTGPCRLTIETLQRGSSHARSAITTGPGSSHQFRTFNLTMSLGGPSLARAPGTDAIPPTTSASRLCRRNRLRLSDMRVTEEEKVWIFSAVLQAKITAYESLGVPVYQRPTMASVVANAIEWTKEAVAAMSKEQL